MFVCLKIYFSKNCVLQNPSHLICFSNYPFNQLTDLRFTSQMTGFQKKLLFTRRSFQTNHGFQLKTYNNLQNGNSIFQASKNLFILISNEDTQTRCDIYNGHSHSV